MTTMEVTMEAQDGERESFEAGAGLRLAGAPRLGTLADFAPASTLGFAIVSRPRRSHQALHPAQPSRRPPRLIRPNDSAHRVFILARRPAPGPASNRCHGRT